MDIERRKRTPPDFQRLLRYLSRAQRQTLSDLQSNGWELYAVRRPSLVETVTLVIDPDAAVYIMRLDGTLDSSAGLRVRKSA